MKASVPLKHHSKLHWGIVNTLLLCSCLASSTGEAQTANNTNDQSIIQSKTASAEDLNTLKNNIKKLQEQLNNFKGESASVRKSLRKSETNIGKLQKRIRSIQHELRQQQQALTKLQNRRQALKKKKHDQQTLMEQHINEAYRLGREKKIKALLNQQSPEQISRVMTYYDYFNRARSEHVEEYRGILTELDEIEPQINEKTQQLKSSKQTLTEQHQSLTVEHKTREKVLRLLESSIKNKDQDLKRLHRDREELEQLLNAVEETIAALNIPGNDLPFVSRKGAMQWPTKGRLRHQYGSQPKPGQQRRQGVSIAANSGNDVVAIHQGRVVFADWFRGKGLLLIIDHGDGFMSLYAHNESLLIETGEWVETGEVITTVGNSGGQRQSGLYFEIRVQGKPTNPAQWCQNRKV